MKPPLHALRLAHHRLRRHATALREGLCRAPVPSERASEETPRETPSTIAAALRFVDRYLATHHAAEEELLLPALRDAIAGSDAVCLREMGTTQAAQHREIEARWRALRQSVQDHLQGGAAPPASEVDHWVALCERHTLAEDQELLPMALRLLSDEALAALEAALRRSQADAHRRLGVHESV